MTRTPTTISRASFHAIVAFAFASVFAASTGCTDHVPPPASTAKVVPKIDDHATASAAERTT